jgi:Na+/melibiose symporter-like transporter
MTEDRELDAWREQWSSIAAASIDGQHKIQQRIKRESQRFVIGNVLSAIVFAGILLFALFVRRQSGWLGTGWGTGICALVFVSVAYRVWILRGTWRPETQTTRAFVALWHRRVLARLRLLRISLYVSFGWTVACAALTFANWTTIRPDVKAHPRDWLGVLVASVLMQPVMWFWAARLRRRKLAELSDVKQILDEMND